MELLLPFAAAVLIGTGVFLVLARALIRVILGLSLISYGVNLSILLSGGLSEGAPPLLDIPGPYVDPLPQALILTAIVIGFGTTALLLVLSIRAYQATGTDEVQELTEKPDPPVTIEPYADPERPSVSPERGPDEDRPAKKAESKPEPATKEDAAEPSKAKTPKDEGTETPTTAKPAKKAKRKKPKAKAKAKEAKPSPAKKPAKKSKDDDVKPSTKSAEAKSGSKNQDESLNKDLKSNKKSNKSEPNKPKANDAEDNS